MMNRLPLTTFQEDLLGALVGLMNSIPGNEEMLADSTDETMWQAIHLLAANVDASAVTRMTEAVRSEKFRIVPGCAVCQHPCGRTLDFDVSLLYSENEAMQAVKWEILARLIAAAPDKNSPEVVRAALRAISEYWDPASLMAIRDKIIV